MFNRSEILRKAWASYRVARTVVFLSGDVDGKRKFYRPVFVKCLRRAWEDAKAEARTANAREANRLAAELQTKIVASQRDLAARMDPQARSARIASIRDELTVLDYASLNARTGNRRFELRAELALLEKAATTQSLAA